MQAHKVVAVFTSQAIAARARDALLRGGFEPQAIRLSTDVRDKVELFGQIEREQTNETFFGWLFRSHPTVDRTLIERHLHGERTAVAVTADGSDEETARALLRGFSPVDLYAFDEAGAARRDTAGDTGGD